MFYLRKYKDLLIKHQKVLEENKLLFDALHSATVREGDEAFKEVVGMLKSEKNMDSMVKSRFLRALWKIKVKQSGNE